MKKNYLSLLLLLLSLIILSSSCKKEEPVVPPEVDPEGISDNDCPNENLTSIIDIGCETDPTVINEYQEIVNGNEMRVITTNTYPDHKYQTKNGVLVEPVDKTFRMSANPELANSTSSVVRDNGRPARVFGIGLNGVVFAPAPAEPFIFENTETGEYNWDWVFEATLNKGNGPDKVALDCSSAHVSQSRGYHYHGNMVEFAKTFENNDGSLPEPFQIGWASDGFPVLYLMGPDGAGGFKELLSSYRLKEGLRPGDGISAPCGSYSGKYTNDFEYIEDAGDLDECNGIERDITLPTVEGDKTFSYFYVITNDFPQISRCLSGTPDSSFD